MYKKVDSSLDFASREKEILKFWKDNDIYKRSERKNEGNQPFSFYDGPPTANGKPHIGHVLTRTMKDIIPRYQTMKGKYVLRKAGWDTHGLPVELEVEKTLGMDGKQDIERYGIEPFIRKCKESVWKYKAEWEKMSDRIGYWVDMDDPYVTYDDNYIESEWWALKTIYEKGLLYKGHRIVPYCPRCGTALSSHEVAQGYKEVKEKSAVVRFRVKGEEKYILAWTTTPWTLPSNVALCMNADEDYSEIVWEGTHYILASALVPKFFENCDTVSVKKGKEYEGLEYEPLYAYAAGTFKERAYYVTNDAYVTLTDGTGVVHIAPAFGEDDSKVGKKYGLPFVQLVDDRGRFKAGTGELEGVFAKDADKMILKDLNARGLLFKEIMFEHSYPFCWRCDTPLLYYARSSWFIKMTAVKDRLIAANATVNWIPETIGTGRMGNFLENVIDWGISRERYWGTPLPVWVCSECGKVHVMGSKAELKELCGIEGDIELHRPYIDSATFACECGGVMKRVTDVIDCWFDSGSMPFAQYHYPFENEKLFRERFPADFISEAVDQTRGWFYTLLAISTLLFDCAPFKNCIVLGHVNDKNGIKMSKHKGNVVDPWTVLDNQGADAVRWYFYTSSAPWLPNRFHADAVSEGERKYMGTLWNTYAFFVLYADIDGYDPSKSQLEKCELTVMDKWLISRLNALIRDVDAHLGRYEIFEAGRKLAAFCDELSNWYVRRGRERFWGKGMTSDKEAAYTVLYTALVTVAKLTAPFTPFMAESIYQNLVPAFYKDAPASVHLCDFPVPDESKIDPALIAEMEQVVNAVVLGRAARNSANVKNRQPLKKAMIAAEKSVQLSPELLAIARDELNVKEIEISGSASDYITYKLKPQLKTLGPKYGKLIGGIKAYLESCDARRVVSAVLGGGVFTAEIEGQKVELCYDDLLVSTESAEGFASASDATMTVALDTAMTPELLDEGTERELVSRLQTMRKEAGFEVTDRIVIGYSASGDVARVLRERADSIASSVLAEKISESLSGYTKQWELGGENFTLSVEKSGAKTN